MNYWFSLIHIISVIFLSYILFKYFGLTNDSFDSNNFHHLLDNIRPSSVWCLGSNINERRCRFLNLCFKTDTNDFVFLYDGLSIKSGLPSDRFSPGLLELSSVSAHNQYYFNFVEIPFNALINNLTKDYKIEFLRGKTFIMSRFKADNLMHYFHDDIIPLYFTLEELGSIQMDYIFLFDNYWQSFHKPFNKKVFENIFPKSLAKNDLKENTIYCMEESFVGLSKATTFYDYGFHSPQSPIKRSKEESALISRTIRKLSERLISDTKCERNDIILISRQKNRKILNEEILIQFISDFTKLRVIRIEDLNNDFEDIIRKVFCSQLLIGIHGSGLMLSQFLQSGSSLIELFPFGINPNYVTPYKTLTQLREMDVHYFYWRNNFINNTITHKEYPKEFGGIEGLTPQEKEQILSNTEDVPQHLCCDNPYWLYRIYSDTIVDINSFAPILDRALKESKKKNTANKLIEPLPGPVLNLRCDQIEANERQLFLVVWEKPWNLDFVDSYLQIKYEILIQEVPSKSAKVSIVSENHFSFVFKSNKTYNIWIRCKINDINGPFNTNPLICLEKSSKE